MLRKSLHRSHSKYFKNLKKKIQYGGHQVVKTNNIYFLKNIKKKKSINNNNNIHKKPKWF